MDTPNTFWQWSGLRRHLFHYETSKSPHELGERVKRAHSTLAARALEMCSSTHLSAELHNTATAARRARENTACSCPNPPVDHERSGEHQKKFRNSSSDFRKFGTLVWWSLLSRAEEGASRAEITFLCASSCTASSPCRNTVRVLEYWNNLNSRYLLMDWVAQIMLFNSICQDKLHLFPVLDKSASLLPCYDNCI